MPFDPPSDLDSARSLKGRNAQADESDFEDDQAGRAIRCASCHCRLAPQEAAISIVGRHQHAFMNPVGVLFSVRCFSTLVACRNEGVPSAEFSWFPGFLWRFAHCECCSVHLGWVFVTSIAAADPAFYGLIAERIFDDEL